MAGKGRYQKKHKNKKDYKSAQQRLTEMFIERLESGSAPWQASVIKPGRPFRASNLLYQNPYNGINRLLTRFALGMKPELTEQAQAKYGKDLGFAVANKFLTFNKIIETMPDVNMKGVKATTYIYEPGRVYYKDKDGNTWKGKDKDGKPRDPTPEEIERYGITTRHASGRIMPMWSAANFVDKIPEKFLNSLQRQIDSMVNDPRHNEDVNVVVNDLLEATGSKLRNEVIEGRTGGYYDPVSEEIVLRPLAMHEHPDRYLKTFLHELTHWTGAESRLNRDTLKTYGETIESRAKEELIAEMGASFLNEYFGVPTENCYHEGYIKSWIGALNDDPKFLLQAAREAEKACELIIGAYEPHVEKKYGSTLDQEAKSISSELKNHYAKPKEEREAENDTGKRSSRHEREAGPSV